MTSVPEPIILHKRQCARHLLHQETRRREFINTYPNYCKSCDAWGSHSFQDYFGEYYENSCVMCLDNDLCPRCMKKTMVEKQEDPDYSVLTNFYSTCTICGWRGDDDYGDAYTLPFVLSCVCSAYD